MAQGHRGTLIGGKVGHSETMTRAAGARAVTTTAGGKTYDVKE